MCLPHFRRFLKGKADGHRPVAITDNEIPTAIAGDTVVKQTSHRPELYVRPQDSALAQRILDEGEMFKSSRRHAVELHEVEARLWRAVVKSTKDESETYLVSFYRMKDRDLAASRQTAGVGENPSPTILPAGRSKGGTGASV